MANLNSEAILASSSYVCGERKGTPHARVCSPRLAGVKYAGTRRPRECFYCILLQYDRVVHASSSQVHDLLISEFNQTIV